MNNDSTENMADMHDIENLKREWRSLSEDERTEIYQDFQEDCIRSSEPSQYWYPLLMPMVMKGYVGD